MKKLILALVAMVSMFSIVGCSDSGPTFDANDERGSLAKMEASLESDELKKLFREDFELVLFVHQVYIAKVSRNVRRYAVKKSANSRNILFAYFERGLKTYAEGREEALKNMHGKSLKEIQKEAAKFYKMTGSQIEELLDKSLEEKGFVFL